MFISTHSTRRKELAAFRLLFLVPRTISVENSQAFHERLDICVCRRTFEKSPALFVSASSNSSAA